MIDPTRINTEQPAVYVSLKANRFYYKTVDELIRDLPTQVSRDPTLTQENRPVITKAVTAVSEKTPSRFSSLFTRRAPRPDAAPRPGSVANTMRSNTTRRVNRPSGPSFLSKFTVSRSTPSIRKGSVANTMRTNRVNAKPPSRFSAYAASAWSRTKSAANATRRAAAKGAQVTGTALSKGAQATSRAVAKGAQVTGTALSKGAQATRRAAIKGAQVTGTALSKGAQATSRVAAKGALATSKGLTSVASRLKGYKPLNKSEPVATPKPPINNLSDNPFA